MYVQTAPTVFSVLVTCELRMHDIMVVFNQLIPMATLLYPFLALYFTG